MPDHLAMRGHFDKYRMMMNGPDIARIASLLGDPGRANMLTALMDGSARTAGELAREAGVGAPTASSHLAKLQAGGLVIVRRQGRHAYYALTGPDVGATLESLMGLAARIGHERVRRGPKEPALREARVCYDHLAGEMGVYMLDGMLAHGQVRASAGELVLTEDGEAFAIRCGIDLAALRRMRRPMCRDCLDWSVRRSHLAGALGAAYLRRFHELGWASRVPGSRIVAFTSIGRKSFCGLFSPG